MTSCILLLYIAALGAPGGGRRAQAPAAAVAAVPDDPDDLYARRETLADARRAADIWAERLRKDTRRLRVGLEAGARTLLAGWTRGRCRSKTLLEEASPPVERAAAPGAGPAGRPLLDCGEHGRAGRVVRVAPGHEVSGHDPRRADDRAEAGPGVPAGVGRPRPRAVVFHGARHVRRVEGEVRGAPPRLP